MDRRNINTLIMLVNYKNKKYTLECLNSLNRIKDQSFHILIIDNSSCDGSTESILEWVKEKKVDCMVIESKNNLGFAGATNIGLDYVLKNSYNYVLLLNNDTVVKENFLQPLIKLAESDLNIGIVGGKTLSPLDDSTNGTGGYIHWFRGFGSNILPKDRQGGVCEVDFVSGCLMLIKRSVLEKIGSMHEQYFLYYEDADYCIRAKKAGFKIMYQPESVIWHKESSSTGFGSAKRYYYLTRARILFNRIFNKYFIIFGSYLSILQFLRMVKWFCLRKFDYVQAVINSQKAFFEPIKEE